MNAIETKNNSLDNINKQLRQQLKSSLDVEEETSSLIDQTRKEHELERKQMKLTISALEESLESSHKEISDRDLEIKKLRAQYREYLKSGKTTSNESLAQIELLESKLEDAVADAKGQTERLKRKAAAELKDATRDLEGRIHSLTLELNSSKKELVRTQSALDGTQRALSDMESGLSLDQTGWEAERRGLMKRIEALEVGSMSFILHPPF
jgi:chromosome segregation ATPase